MTLIPASQPEPFREKLCLFGAGRYYLDCREQFLLALRKSPDFFCDNAREKWGNPINGLICHGPEALLPWRDQLTVIITARQYEPIAEQLRSMGIADIRVACFDRGYDTLRAIKPMEHAPSSFPTPVSSLQGRRALITGGMRGIGFEIAKALASLGVHLILHGRSLKSSWPGMELLLAHGVTVKQVAADLGDDSAIKSLLQSLDEQGEAVDILFNNAGISLPSPDFPLCSDPELYHRHFQINAVAPIQITSHLIPGMIKRSFGRIINISSTIQRQTNALPYACSKAALDKFVHDAAPSLRGTGVAMSLLCPGHVRSDMGGPSAPHSLESVAPGALLGALLGPEINGRFLMAQDYAGLSIQDAMSKANGYLDLQEGA